MAATRPEAASSADQLDRFGVVTSRTKHDLERFVALLVEWQRAHNLVAPGALAEIWTRHVADSLQLLAHAPPGFREWVDLGSGAGFPGLVVAIVSRDWVPHPGSGGGGPPKAVEGADIGAAHVTRPLHHASHGPLPPSSHDEGGTGCSTSDRVTGTEARHFTLVESNAKKAAFLRAAIRETGANATVAAERIEAHATGWGRRADVISARALAPLPALLGLAAPYVRKESLMLLLKGREYVEELVAASQTWAFDVVDYASATDSGGRVLAIRNLSPKAPTP